MQVLRPAERKKEVRESEFPQASYYRVTVCVRLWLMGRLFGGSLWFLLGVLGVILD
jgi:hypothetical protein